VRSTDENQKLMTFGEHLEELRRRLILVLVGLTLAFLVCFFGFGGALFRLLWRPMGFVLADLARDAATTSMPLTTQPIMTSPAAAFLIRLKTAFVAAFVAASPWVLWQMWAFISAGLYRHERRYVYILAPFSLGFFAAGVLFCYFVLMPYGLQFLVSQGLSMGAQPLITVNEYFSFALGLMLVLGVAFQLPLVMMFLAKSGIVSVKTFRRRRRYAILSMVIAAALFTPPDPATQLFLAGPLIGLYELGILLSRVRLGGRGAGADSARTDDA